MGVASFEDLCRGLCELAGVATPALERDEEGSLAVVVPAEGLEVTLTHEPARSATHVFVLAGVGPLPQGGELDACKALLEINAGLLRHAGLCFSRDPQTGDMLLQQACALDDTTPVGLYQRVRELSVAVHEWRQRAGL
jgi:hypothetical protein